MATGDATTAAQADVEAGTAEAGSAGAGRAEGDVEGLVAGVEAALRVVADGVPLLSEEVVVGLVRGVSRLRGELDRLSVALTQRVRVLHDLQAGPSPEDVWSREGRAGSGQARQESRRARQCQEHPLVGDGFAQGAISAAHLDVLARVRHGVDAQLRDAFDALADQIAHQARICDVDGFEWWCRHTLVELRERLGRDHHHRQLRDTRLRRWIDPHTGMYRWHGEFHPDLGRRLAVAVDQQIDQLRAHGLGTLPGDPVGPVEGVGDRDHLAAYALGQLVLQSHRHRAQARPEVLVLIDERTLVEGWHDQSVCEDHHGTPMPTETVRRLVCDTQLRRVILGAAGEVVDVGRSTRLATRAQRRALRAMYRTCAWEHCPVRFDHCEIHHLTPWEHGGSTDLVNLVPLCVHHHHHTHELGWTLTMSTADRSLTITRPDGRPYTTITLPGLRPRSRTGRAGLPADRPPGRPPDPPPRPAERAGPPDQAEQPEQPHLWAHAN